MAKPEEHIQDVDFIDMDSEVDTLCHDISGFSLTPDVVPVSYMEASRRTVDHKYKPMLGHIERMAGQGMEPPQIAARLNIPVQDLLNAAELYEDVRVAFTGGRARLIDQMSFSMQQGALKGDLGAAKFLLQTKGDFVPANRVDSGNLPQNGPAPVDIGSIANRLQDQRSK